MGGAKKTRRRGWSWAWSWQVVGVLLADLGALYLDALSGGP